MNLKSYVFGQTAQGEPVTAFVLSNSCDTRVTVLDYGATVQSVVFAGTELVHGYETVQGYENGRAYFGATIGRTCNRIGGASFSLNGKTYSLAANDGRNQLHGGVRGFHQRMWRAAQIAEGGLTLVRFSPDGEEGYPGNLTARVTFLLTEENALHIRYDAAADRDTLVSMTNHSYFNLSGNGSALTHILTCPAETYVENTAETLPTGRLLPVEGTPFDFRRGKSILQGLRQNHAQLRQARGYDHTLVAQEAALQSPETGIALHVKTDLPGIHLYSANYVHERARSCYQPQSAVCLETQLFADAIHHEHFPSPILRAGQHWRSETVYAFYQG